ncbi:hypothetical protein [Kitasatospora herbaricolor]|uniref:Uncharacterized protein n=1 Tax=Kitasatospora herbaricolor TaxID=68217 RepID=A0ABZ1WHC1_9ACTN|nr:hypothetical protein [Kitasatospora herbaricolor]
MLAQAARATKDGPLLELVASCHPGRRGRSGWTNTMIKTLAPRLLASPPLTAGRDG